MSRRDVILAEKIKNQPPNTSHLQLEEITIVPKSTISRFIQQQEKQRDKWILRL
jgi:hypothetical protein